LIQVRSLIFVALFYLWSVAFALAMIPFLALPAPWMTRVLGVWSAGINLMLRAICGVRVEIRGRENIPKGDAIVAPKHQCMLDVFAQFGVLPDPFFVMKQELKWIPLFGWYGIKMGALLVDRDGHAKALKKMVRESLQRFGKGDRQLLIFPEGTRGEPGVPGDYKPGIAALYRELNVPVHPVATNSGVHWPAHGFLRKPGLIVFEYLEPIPAGLKRAEFMRTLEERIETASNRLLSL
jgi:1-acyl-sn-glycerol-3-phosphate acyltransferase